MEMTPKEAIILAVVVLAIVGGFFWFGASQEAATFNKFSDKDASAWDAIWAELRVEACN